MVTETVTMTALATTQTIEQMIGAMVIKATAIVATAIMDRAMAATATQTVSLLTAADTE
jgi:hypothetical protein